MSASSIDLMHKHKSDRVAKNHWISITPLHKIPFILDKVSYMQSAREEEGKRSETLHTHLLTSANGAEKKISFETSKRL